MLLVSSQTLKSIRFAESKDAGLRAWYESCLCYLSESHPDVKRALNEEKTQLQPKPPVTE
jgi:hypothetical protein